MAPVSNGAGGSTGGRRSTTPSTNASHTRTPARTATGASTSRSSILRNTPSTSTSSFISRLELPVQSDLSAHSLQSSRNAAQRAWLSDLKALWSRSHQRFPDVAWCHLSSDTSEGSQGGSTTGGIESLSTPPSSPGRASGGDIIWAHSAILLTRAPQTFQSKNYLNLPLVKVSPSSPSSASTDRNSPLPSPGRSPTPIVSSSQRIVRSSLRGSSLRGGSLRGSSLRGSSVPPSSFHMRGKTGPSTSSATGSSNGPSPAKQTQAMNLHGTGVDLTHFKAMLTYLYTAEVDDLDEDVWSLLQMDSLQDTTAHVDRLRADLLALWKGKQHSDVTMYVSSSADAGSATAASRSGTPLGTRTELPSSTSSLSSHLPPMADVEAEESQGQFASHRCVLMSRCPYFAAQFSTHSDSKFSDSSSQSINLPPGAPFTPTALYFTLGFIYTGTLQFTPRTFDLTLAFQIWKVGSYLQIKSLTHLMTSMIIHDFSHGFQCATPCGTCQKRVPRILTFSTSPDVGDHILASLALQALTTSNNFAAYWEREIGSMSADLRDEIVTRVKKRVSEDQNQVVPVLRQLMILTARLDVTRAVKWVDNLKNMVEDITTHLQTGLVNNFSTVITTTTFQDLISGIGLHYDLLDHLFTLLTTSRNELHLPKLYQSIVGDILLAGEEGMEPGLIRDKVENTIIELIKLLKKSWISIRLAKGFNGLQKWALKEIAAEIGVDNADELILPDQQQPVKNESKKSSMNTGERTAGPINLRAAVLNRNAARVGARSTAAGAVTKVPSGSRASSSTLKPSASQTSALAQRQGQNSSGTSSTLKPSSSQTSGLTSSRTQRQSSNGSPVSTGSPTLKPSSSQTSELTSSRTQRNRQSSNDTSLSSGSSSSSSSSAARQPQPARRTVDSTSQPDATEVASAPSPPPTEIMLANATPADTHTPANTATTTTTTPRQPRQVLGSKVAGLAARFSAGGSPPAPLAHLPDQHQHASSSPSSSSSPKNKAVPTLSPAQAEVQPTSQPPQLPTSARHRPGSLPPSMSNASIAAFAARKRRLSSNPPTGTPTRAKASSQRPPSPQDQSQPPRKVSQLSPSLSTHPVYAAARRQSSGAFAADKPTVSAPNRAASVASLAERRATARRNMASRKNDNNPAPMDSVQVQAGEEDSLAFPLQKEAEADAVSTADQVEEAHTDAVGHEGEVSDAADQNGPTTAQEDQLDTSTAELIIQDPEDGGEAQSAASLAAEEPKEEEAPPADHPAGVAREDNVDEQEGDAEAKAESADETTIAVQDADAPQNEDTNGAAEEVKTAITAPDDPDPYVAVETPQVEESPKETEVEPTEEISSTAAMAAGEVEEVSAAATQPDESSPGSEKVSAAAEEGDSTAADHEADAAENAGSDGDVDRDAAASKDQIGQAVGLSDGEGDQVVDGLADDGIATGEGDQVDDGLTDDGIATGEGGDQPGGSEAIPPLTAGEHDAGPDSDNTASPLNNLESTDTAQSNGSVTLDANGPLNNLSAADNEESDLSTTPNLTPSSSLNHSLSQLSLSTQPFPSDSPGPCTPRAIRTMTLPVESELTPRPSKFISDASSDEASKASLGGTAMRAVRSDSDQVMMPPATTLSVGIPCIIWPSFPGLPPRTRMRALVKYLGPVDGFDGPMIGVEVPLPLPEHVQPVQHQFNDGSYHGKRYFYLGPSWSRAVSVAGSGAVTPASPGSPIAMSSSSTLGGGSRLSIHLDMFAKAEREARKRRIARLQANALRVVSSTSAPSGPWSSISKGSESGSNTATIRGPRHSGPAVSSSSGNHYALSSKAIFSAPTSPPEGYVRNRRNSGMLYGLPNTSVSTLTGSIESDHDDDDDGNNGVGFDSGYHSRHASGLVQGQGQGQGPPPFLRRRSSMMRSPSMLSLSSLHEVDQGRAVSHQRSKLSPRLTSANLHSHHQGTAGGDSSSRSSSPAFTFQDYDETDEEDTPQRKRRGNMSGGGTTGPPCSYTPLDPTSLHMMTSRSRRSSWSPSVAGSIRSSYSTTSTFMTKRNSSRGGGSANFMERMEDESTPRLGLFVRPDEVVWVFDDD
ncbi:unnamed protein product [Sympodiomycopsis kandeliae]